MKNIFPFLFLLVPYIAQADSKITLPQIYLFVQSSSIAPTEVNDYLSTNGIEKFTNLYGVGMEVSQPIFPRFNLGARVSMHYQSQNEKAKPSANPTNPYYGTLQQVRGAGVARLGLVQSNLMRVDAVGGAGMTNGRLTTHLSGGDATIDDGYNNNKMSNFYSFYGASVAVGWKQFYFVTEAGYEMNKVGKLKCSTNATHSISTLDLSGGYVTIGLMWGSPPSSFRSR